MTPLKINKFNHMKINFSAKDKPQEWLATIAQQFGVKVVDNAFEVSPLLGKGLMKQIYFFEGFTLTYLHFNLTQPLEFIRHSIKDAKLFPVMFYSQDFTSEQDIDEQKKLIGYHTSNGIFIPSPQTESRWTVPSGAEGFQITLTVDKNWFAANCVNENTLFFKKLLESDKSFYLFESLQPTMKIIIDSIHELINSEHKLKQFKLHLKAMELFNLFLEQIEERNTKENISTINPIDVDKIFETRKIILENLPHVPSLKKLSLDVGMSISKLQKCFKQVFGKSISKYALFEKMNLAKQMLNTNRYSVSEVGYQLGYSNLSHFTKAFYKEFKINPKAYLISLV